MKTIATCALGVILLSTGSAVAADRQVTLAVGNMNCATCGPIVRQSLARVPGVKHVTVSPEKGTAVVVFDDAVTNISKLVGVTTDAGYPSHALPSTS